MPATTSQAGPSATMYRTSVLRDDVLSDIVERTQERAAEPRRTPRHHAPPPRTRRKPYPPPCRSGVDRGGHAFVTAAFSGPTPITHHGFALMRTDPSPGKNGRAAGR